MAWRPEGPVPSTSSLLGPQLTLFLGFYGLLIGVLGLWSRPLARRVRGSSLRRQIRYFDTVIFAARIVILIWFGIGLFFLGWGELVSAMLRPLTRYPIQLPQAIVGTLPCL